MLNHIDKKNRPTMVDISSKETTKRSATATARIIFPEVIKDRFRDGDLQTKKGPVIDTAIIAGTMAVKKTHDLIPFCHPLNINACHISIEPDDNQDFIITCEVDIEHKTGVEMEALTGVSVAALTVYDMCKSLSHEIVISDISLKRKTGGKTDIDIS
ncbi:MAG: cyclic pyranopterin monophosphate synthase MoaC [Gammaproteobacteria bacterium]|nr:cyclic pyranopterin monophosphate synthase MoaC [Gammaproteobacteria bacterium]